MPQWYTPALPSGAPTPASFAEAVGRVLGMERHGGAADGLLADGGRAVARAGVALDPSPWIATAGLDAVVLHRPWELEPAPGLTVVAAHEALDHELTPGAGGTRVAEALGLRSTAPLGELGLVGDVEAPDRWRERLELCFGGLEAWRGGGDAPVRRVALVGALRPALVRAAADAGAGLYVTGQWRPRARDAVDAAGVAVAAVGHERVERWALRTLAALLRERLPGVEIVVEPPGEERWLVDGMNVIGTRPDGWWRDRPGAHRAFAERLDRFARATAARVEVVFDGAAHPVAGGRVEVRFASRRGRDAADDDLAARAAPGTRVVTSDAALAARAHAAGARVVGAGAFLRALDLVL
jgi:putative NIF3 family GTP cyclohydrolase 1 type 2